MTALAPQQQQADPAGVLLLAARTYPKILVVAHRGFWGVAPENSLSSIRLAADVGVEIVEIDVQATADGQLVLMHDESIDRTTTGSGIVAISESTQIRPAKLRGGAGDGIVTDETVPSLEEALEEARGRVCINIDTKFRRDLPAVVRAVKDLGMQDQVVIKTRVDPLAARHAVLSEDWFGTIPHMPMFKVKKGLFAAHLQAITALKPPMVEVGFSDLADIAEARETFEALNIRIWINTLDVSHSLDYNDTRALQEPDAVWGALADAGVGAIQTDAIMTFLAWRASRAK